jgi:hypothetical protein
MARSDSKFRLTVLVKIGDDHAMSRLGVLTNHWYMIVALVVSASVPLLLNAAFEFVPLRYGTNLIGISLYSVHGIWLILVAAAMRVLGPFNRLELALVLVAVFVALTAFVYFPRSIETESMRRHDLAQAASLLIVTASLVLGALIADKISRTRAGIILNFLLVLNWPFFLFLLSSRLRKAAV